MPIVVTWNVAGRVRTVDLQAAALATQPADLIALQEIRLSSLAAWRTALRDLGFEHVLTSLDGHDPNVPLAPERRLGVLIAGSAPLEPLPTPPGVPWPERVLSARTEIGELVNLHAPISSKAEEAKVRTLEAVHGYLAGGASGARSCVLVGDLNTPQYESREGEVSSFARTRSGRIRPAYGERHDRAELLLITGLAQHGWIDAFRDLHGYSRRDRSWLYPHRKMGYRIDHVMARGLRVEACEYRHDWRDAGLSDHAGMWAALV
jgi:exonuclease III